MRIRQVDFPQEIIDAQRDGSLVIFAGAGASIDPPSNYPDFRELANKIGGDHFPRKEGEAIDRYLGRLVERRVTVHERVRSTLSSPGSKPNSVHQAITRIFKNIGTFRLVTTNFDSHFTSAARARAGGLQVGRPVPGRFALTVPDEDVRWRNLGICPVHYPASAPPRSKHDELGIALAAWGEQAHAGALDTERRIRGQSDRFPSPEPA